MSELQDGDFELNGYRIGDRDSVFIYGFEPSDPEWRDQDADNPVADGRLFGRDYRAGATWTLDFASALDTRAESSAAIAALASKWRSGKVTPGAESVLRFRLAGKSRRVYGRPRAFSYQPTFHSGTATAAATFVTGDPWIYDDTAQVMVATMFASSKGGLKTPLKGNLTGVKGGVQNGAIPQVGGDAPAPFTATIHGPIRNPSIASGNWLVEVSTTLAYDQSLTIDTRKNTVIRNDGTSLGGRLTRVSRLNTARLKPGPANILFSGIDPTGTSRVVLTWRPTFYSI